MRAVKERERVGLDCMVVDILVRILLVSLLVLVEDDNDCVFDLLLDGLICAFVGVNVELECVLLKYC